MQSVVSVLALSVLSVLSALQWRSGSAKIDARKAERRLSSGSLDLWRRPTRRSDKHNTYTTLHKRHAFQRLEPIGTHFAEHCLQCFDRQEVDRQKCRSEYRIANQLEDQKQLALH